MMKLKLTGFSREYRAALQRHLRQRGRKPALRPASGLGRRALTIGIETLDLARIHEQSLVELVLPNDAPATRATMVRRAGSFFAKAITPMEKTHRTAREANAHLNQMIQTLTRRSLELIAANRQLKQEIARRESAEQSLRSSEQHYSQLLEQSRHMQEQLRLLSRQFLSAQEEERKRISRELHDVIAQTLTSINVRLASLKKDATVDAKGLERKIARTQQLIERSVDIVHRFARELRPTVLDDLGLIPALYTLLKSFRKQTGIRVSLSAFAAVEQVNGDKRTVLYRVVQEALTNAARHSQANLVSVKIQKVNGAIDMKIKDNGKGFDKERVLHAQKDKRLGLLGMRERLEMVGGHFNLTSTPGRGTTVHARMPFFDRTLSSGRRENHDNPREDSSY